MGELTEYVVALATGDTFRVRQITDVSGQTLSAGDPVRVSWQWSNTRLF
jgi:hypothetical protein